jgi:hypothetical protein
LSGGISPENTFQRHWSIIKPIGRNAIFFERAGQQQPGYLQTHPASYRADRSSHHVPGVTDSDGVADRP